MSVPKFKMPAVRAGMPILWSPRLGGSWTPGFVTRVNNGSIAVGLLRTGATSFVPHEGVRHASDPGFATLGEQKHGIWKHTPETELLSLLANIVFNDGGDVYGDGVPSKLKELRSQIPGLDAYTPASDGGKSGDDPDSLGA